MERKKGWKAERLENKHIRKRKLAEGDKIQTGKKKKSSQRPTDQN